MSFSSDYSFIDRALHWFAFCSPIVQKILGELESDLFNRELALVDSRQEVFVTGLPRAGTTLMLELLYATKEFNSYTYRDMPFILAPLIWNKLSRHFRKGGAKQERAHGDGLEISFDSPEAFEEVVWLAYMGKEIIQEHTLTPLPIDRITEESRAAIKGSIRKVLALAQHDGRNSHSLRYLSKNNANVSRIDSILKLFPTSSIVVLFRHPLAHISSLAKQHERFLQEHARDAFSKKYMKWIGHYEFGGNFKPINFEDWLGDAEMPPRVDDEFWMRYWSAAYSFALKHESDRVYFVDFDKLLQDRAASLERISKALDLKHAKSLIKAAKTIRSPTTRPVEVGSYPRSIWERAQKIHNQLKLSAI